MWVETKQNKEWNKWLKERRVKIRQVKEKRSESHRSESAVIQPLKIWEVIKDNRLGDMQAEMLL